MVPKYFLYLQSINVNIDYFYDSNIFFSFLIYYNVKKNYTIYTEKKYNTFFFLILKLKGKSSLYILFFS